MPDIPSPAPGKTPEEIALGCVTHILRCIQSDPNFAWLFGHTESFRQLCLAYAALTDTPFEEVQRAAKEGWLRVKGDSEVDRLRRRVEELEARP